MMNLIKISLCISTLLIFLNVRAQHTVTEAAPKPDFENGVINSKLAAKAETHAKKWLEALVYHDTLQLINLTGFPFAWDRIEIISEGKTFLEKTGSNAKQKNRQAGKEAALLKTLTVETIDARRTLIDKLIPIHVYIVGFRIKEGNTVHGGRIAVQMLPQLKVIGFSD